MVEAGKRVLAEFAPDLSQDAADALGALGVQIRTDTEVTGMRGRDRPPDRWDHRGGGGDGDLDRGDGGDAGGQSGLA